MGALSATKALKCDPIDALPALGGVRSFLLGSVCVACWRFQPSRAYTDGGVRLAAVPHARENVLEIRVAPPWIVPAATRKGLAS